MGQNVYIVDDDREVRRSITFMLTAAKLQPRPFASGPDFLDSLSELQPGVILLDLHMPEMDGFRFLAELASKRVEWPVLVMTGHGDISTAVRAMKLGAVDFLAKPFPEEALLAALEASFTLLKDRTEMAQRRRTAEARVAALSARENEVLRGLIAGLSNKELAQRIGISLRTVEMHRANMMERLEVEGLAEALALAARAGVDPLQGQPA
ncbi:MAG: response regulator [Pseudomonadota bacterium]|nr:response regulator [Pseudomonadota bacterium]